MPTSYVDEAHCKNECNYLYFYGNPVQMSSRAGTLPLS